MYKASKESKEYNSNYCIFAILITEILTVFVIGFHLSALNSSSPVIKIFINDTYTLRYGEFPTSSTVTFILALAQSSLIWGSLAGSLMVKLALSKISRKHALLLVHGINIFSSILMGPIAQFAPSYESLIIGRFVAGVARGIAFSLFAVVIAETTCRRRIGFYLGPFAPLMFVSAAIGAGLGHPKALGTSELWFWIVCIPAVASIIYICFSHWLPETPVSLLKNGKREEALAILRLLRVGNNVETEFKILEEEMKDSSSIKSISILKMLKTPSLRRQLFTTIIVLNGCQFIGLQAVCMYSDSQLLSAGIEPRYVTFVTMAIFSGCLVAFAIAVPIQRKFGTKKLYIVGLCVVSISYVVFIVAGVMQNTSESASYVALVGMCMTVFGMQLGPQFALLALPTELTTANTRPTVIFCSSCIFWFIGGLISFVFPYSLTAWGAFAYLPFLLISIAMIPFMVVVVPETHKRSAARIQSSFRKKSTQTSLFLSSNDEQACDREESN